MKVLITGANGQLGQELVEVFEKDWTVVPTDQQDLDITNADKVEDFVLREKPNWVIHCAAWTDVEGCAQDPQKAMEINAEATKNLAKIVKLVQAKMLYISTNEVFDGQKKEPYLEIDKPNPINPYAVSKLAGEKFVQEILGKDGVVVRTSWVYGPKGKSNFALKIISAADKSGELKVVDDEMATPTYALDLARAVFELIQKNPFGIYHLVNQGSCSRYEWAVEILKDSGREKIKIVPTKLKDYVRKSRPPTNSILANIRANEVGVALRFWKEASSDYLKNLSH